MGAGDSLSIDARAVDLEPEEDAFATVGEQLAFEEASEEQACGGP